MRLGFKGKVDNKTLNISNDITLWDRTKKPIEFPTEEEANEYLSSNSYVYNYMK